MHIKDLLLNVINSFLEYFFINFGDTQFVFHRPSSGKLFIAPLGLSLKISGIQPPMRLAIPTHVSADTEFTCKGFILDCGLSLGTPVLKTKANRVMPFQKHSLFF